MNWRESWHDHVKKTGDFWVDRTFDRYQVMDKIERDLNLRKKKGLKKRSAQIVKSTVNGRVVGHHKVGDEDHVNYRQHLAFLVKQGDHFYIEEQEVEKQSVFQKGKIKRDRTIHKEASQIERQRILYPKSKNITRNEPRFTYDREAVVKYADKWWNRKSPEYPDFDVDCTNYVSQCLRAGGVPMTHVGEKNKGWWVQGKACSYSWSVANALRWYLASDGNIMNAVAVDEPDQLVPGDIICYDWDGDGNWDHSTIVTDLDANGMPLVNAHTYDSRHRYWEYEDSPAYTENTQYKFFHIDAD